MGCANWSRVNLQAEPGVAYLAIPRTGSGSLRALLAKLHGVPNDQFPHDHSCGMKGLLETHKARRVLVLLRELHVRIVSEFARSRKRGCRPPAWQGACAYPPVLRDMPAAREWYLDAAPERFVQTLMAKPSMPVPYFMRPTSVYFNTNWSTKRADVRYVCTCTLREGSKRILESWGVIGVADAWNAITDRHVTNTSMKLSAASIDYLRKRFPKDYSLVEGFGCDQKGCATPQYDA